MNNKEFQFCIKQTTCDHGFSFSILSDVPVFKCESCLLEREIPFIGEINAELKYITLHAIT